MDSELEVFFPALADSAQLKEFFGLLKRRTLATLDYVIDGTPKEAIEVEDERIFMLAEPKTFSGNKGLEIQFIRAFEESCVIMSQHINRDPKKMTVVEFYYSLEALKRQLKPGRNKIKPLPNVKPN